MKLSREKLLLRKNMLLPLFFDLGKAFDSTWKYGILRDMYELGFRGRLPCFIDNFISDHLFQVKIGFTLYEFHVQENGIHQGSILPPVLFSFNIKISDIIKALLEGSESSLFVYDPCPLFKGQVPAQCSLFVYDPCPLFKGQVPAQCHQTASVI